MLNKWRDIIEWYVNVIKNYIQFNGRARREEYWMFILSNIFISIAIGFIGGIIGLPIISTVYALLVIMPSLAVGVRRFHDVGKSGWIFIGFQIITLFIDYITDGLFRTSLFDGSFSKLIAECIVSLAYIGYAIFSLVILCTEDEPGTNKYGPDPKCNN